MPILEKIELGGIEYYQFRVGKYVGDIFSDWRDIEYYREKIKEECYAKV